MTDQIHFSEKQRMNQWWFYVPLIFILVFFISRTLFTSDEVSDNNRTTPFLDLYFPLILIGLCIWLILSLRLQTIIRDDGLYVRLFPFHISYKQYRWEDLKKIYVRKYNPIMEYGGWGLKGSSKNRAYNLHGNIGLQLVFNDGKKLLIGTNKQKELTEILMSLKQYKE